MLHTFEDWFCSAKLLDFPLFCYCTFLYRLISVVSYFYLYFSYLRKRKTLPHGFFTNELRRADYEVHDIADGRYDGRIQKFQQGISR